MSQMQMSKSCHNFWEEIVFSALLWALNHIWSEINQPVFVLLTHSLNIIVHLSIKTEILYCEICPVEALRFITNREDMVIKD